MCKLALGLIDIVNPCLNVRNDCIQVLKKVGAVGSGKNPDYTQVQLFFVVVIFCLGRNLFF